MPSSIVTGLASYGMSGKIFHAPFLQKHPSFDFKYVLQRSKQDSKEKYPHVNLVKSFEDLLKLPDLDLVVINTPSYLHYEMTKAALLAGKHVVVEKPFTSTYDEASELIRMAETRDLILTVYHNKRLEGNFKTIKSLLDQKLFGEVKHVHSAIHRFKPEIGTKVWKEDGRAASGLLYDLGSHMIDQTLQLFGAPSSFDAKLDVQRKSGKVIDFFNITFHYESFDVTMVSDMLTKESLPTWKILGTNASFIKYGVDPQENSLSQENVDWVNLGRDKPEDFGYLELNSSRETVPTAKGNYMEFYDNLAEAIVLNKDLLVPPQEAAEVIKYIEKIGNSIGFNSSF